MTIIDKLTGPAVGIDGCPSGWIAVSLVPNLPPKAAIFATFRELLDGVSNNAVIVVDMPIGLPERGEKGGRVAERAARLLANVPSSSVFGIPSRQAVYAETAEGLSQVDKLASHRRAVAVARATSATATGFSIQAFSIFPRIRQIDQLVRAQPALLDRVLESHPEVAFCALNGWRRVARKKSADGIEQRKQILTRIGFEREFLNSAPPRKAKVDDFLDAACMAAVAVRHTRGEAIPHPSPLERDAHGIPIAIWA